MATLQGVSSEIFAAAFTSGYRKGEGRSFDVQRHSHSPVTVKSKLDHGNAGKLKQSVGAPNSFSSAPPRSESKLYALFPSSPANEPVSQRKVAGTSLAAYTKPRTVLQSPGEKLIDDAEETGTSSKDFHSESRDKNQGNAEASKGNVLLVEEKEINDKYERELYVATQAVQLGCRLSQRVQEGIRKQEESADTKKDKSLVTVADWGVQAVVSWVLSQAFPDVELSMVGEEDSEGLKGREGFEQLQRVVAAVNECLAEGPLVGLAPPAHPLDTVEVLKAINRGASAGGTSGRHWVLDPVDGTLGFVRGDQYAVALALLDEGQVAVGVLGCPNLPKRPEWLQYPLKYHRMAEALFPPPECEWSRGGVFGARRGGGGAWVQPLADGYIDGARARHLAERVTVSAVAEPADATFCEPVEKSNSNQSFSAGVADSLGMLNKPLRVYSMVKYAAIARGDAEIFMKFASATYKEKIWDHAAGVILVEEAGGIVTDAGGQPLDFSRGRYLEGLDRGIIACSSPKLHALLLASVDASWNSSKL
eukprot:jgi/Mesen1/4484/ME000228S03438